MCLKLSETVHGVASPVTKSPRGSYSCGVLGTSLWSLNVTTVDPYVRFLGTSSSKQVEPLLPSRGGMRFHNVVF